MERFGRDEPLPSGMQGYWHDAEDAKAELIIDGGEISYLGRTISYDYKVVETDDGALTVRAGFESFSCAAIGCGSSADHADGSDERPGS